jgi:hypothetical protein
MATLTMRNRYKLQAAQGVHGQRDQAEIMQNL